MRNFCHRQQLKRSASIRPSDPSEAANWICYTLEASAAACGASARACFCGWQPSVAPSPPALPPLPPHRSSHVFHKLINHKYSPCPKQQLPWNMKGSSTAVGRTCRTSTRCICICVCASLSLSVSVSVFVSASVPGQKLCDSLFMLH